MSICARILRLCLPAMLVASTQSLAQNLVANPSFDIHLGGWYNFGPAGGSSTAWDPLDSGGSSVSGSALLTNTAASGTSASGLWQCVPVVPGVSYFASMKVLVPGAVASGGYPALQVNWFAGTNCGGMISPTSTQFAPASDVWTTVRTSPATAPPNAITALVQPYIFKTSAGGTYQAWVDDIGLMPASSTLTIPASASIHGLPPTFFHTDLWILNNSPVNTAVVALRHRCPAAQTCAGGTKMAYLRPRTSNLFPDVIGILFGDPETSGVIEISYDPSVASITAGSRTYTPSWPAPTNGTTVPALLASEARTHAIFWGLSAYGGNTAGGFRSNAGAYNPWDSSVDVTFTLYDSGGILAGSPWTKTLGPHEPFQADVFKLTNNSGVVTTNHYLVATSTAPVFSYVTVVDNQTGDTIFVPASDDR